MLSLFPTLFSYSQISPLLIRITLAVVLLFWAYKALRTFAGSSLLNKTGCIVEVVVGVLLLLGLWTQGAAIVAVIDLIVRLVERGTKRAILTDGVNYYLILLVLALSLIVTGPGIWARDILGL